MTPMKEASPPVSAMATPTNSSGNLVDEFEEAFQVSSLTLYALLYSNKTFLALLECTYQGRSCPNIR